MTFARVILTLFALLFIGLGVAFLLFPVSWASTVGFELQGTLAVNEIRTFYGGLELGIGGFLLFAAFTRSLLRAGVIVQVALFGGLAFGRTFSLLVDGSPGPLGAYFLSTDLLGLISGLFALLRLRGAGQSR